MEFRSPPHLFSALLFETGSLTGPGASSLLCLDLLTSKAPGCDWVCLLLWGYRCFLTHPAFYVGPRKPDSGVRVYAERVLPTEPSPQPHVEIVLLPFSHIKDFGLVPQQLAGKQLKEQGRGRALFTGNCGVLPNGSSWLEVTGHSSIQ